MSKLCIDLCSGLGGFSRAFVDAGWEVITVDIDPEFNPTICKDVRTLTADEIFKVLHLPRTAFEKVVVLASPPCERFSLACRTWPKAGIRKSLDIVGAILELIVAIHPDEWMLENPKARLRWFLGTPRGTIRLSDYGAPYLKPTDYWGSIVLPMLNQTTPPKMYLRPMKHDKKMPSPIYLSGKGIGKAERAKMPYGLSQAVLEAVESQP